MADDGWSRKLAKRFQQQFDEIVANHNRVYGPEVEIAVCEVLRRSVPRRASVYRGCVVDCTGCKPGDDVIGRGSATLRARQSKSGRRLRSGSDERT